MWRLAKGYPGHLHRMRPEFAGNLQKVFFSMRTLGLVYLLYVYSTATQACRTSVDVAIVGAGPGGLSAALAIRKNSPSTSIAVFERDEFQPKGASIAISPSGWKAIKGIDEVVAERVKATGLPVTNVAVLSFDGGEKSDSGPLPLRIGLWGVNTAMSVARKVTSIFRRKEGGRGGGGVAITYTHLWHDVRMCLADRVREICGDSALQPGMTLVALRETSDDTGCRFELDFTCNSDGEEMTVCTGAIIACDGVGSTVRKLSREPKARDVQLL